LIRIVCPAFSPATSNNACHAVNPAVGSAAESASATDRGAAANVSAGASPPN
jgi:hypothetical protein